MRTGWWGSLWPAQLKVPEMSLFAKKNTHTDLNGAVKIDPPLQIRRFFNGCPCRGGQPAWSDSNVFFPRLKLRPVVLPSCNLSVLAPIWPLSELQGGF